MTKLKQRHILLGIPTVCEQFTASLGRFLFSIGKMQEKVNLPVAFSLYISNGSSIIAFPVEYQRNLIIKHFLNETDCDDLWFIDSDVLPTENSFELLNVQGADIVGGIYAIPNEGDAPAVWSIYEKNGDGFRPKAFDSNKEEVLPCDAIATGCIIIPRRVFENPKMIVDASDSDLPAWFRTPRKVNGKIQATDDIDFCRRAAAAGYTLRAHTGVRWGHSKTIDATKIFRAGQKAFLQGVECGVDYALEHGKRTVADILESRPKVSLA